MFEYIPHLSQKLFYYKKKKNTTKKKKKHHEKKKVISSIKTERKTPETERWGDRKVSYQVITVAIAASVSEADNP